MALRDWLAATATLATPATVRCNLERSVASVAAVAVAGAAANEYQATPEQARELSELIAMVGADWPEVERKVALTAALAHPESALECYRELAAQSRLRVESAIVGDDQMRTCGQCRNLSPGGRCLAAWRGESFGAGTVFSRNYAPSPEVLLRCACYVPGAEDKDQRSGAERWPFLLE